MAKKRILVVDDDPTARGLMREILGDQFEISEAEDGVEALGILRKEKFDLLVTDRAMPKLGGIELLEKLRDEKLSLPSIMVSAFGEESFWAQAIAAGAGDYILKPYSYPDVLKSVKKHLGLK